MPVHAHADRLARLAAAVEELAGVEQCDVDELVRVGEVDRLDVQRARRRHDDQVSVGAMSLDVVDQATVGQQADACSAIAWPVGST
jgi:hypothetical protein